MDDYSEDVWDSMVRNTSANGLLSYHNSVNFKYVELNAFTPQGTTPQTYLIDRIKFRITTSYQVPPAVAYQNRIYGTIGVLNFKEKWFKMEKHAKGAPKKIVLRVNIIIGLGQGNSYIMSNNFDNIRICYRTTYHKRKPDAKNIYDYIHCLNKLNPLPVKAGQYYLMATDGKLRVHRNSGWQMTV